MKKLQYLVIHCTATPQGRNLTVAEVRRMHTSPVRDGGRGWRVPGYSDLILLNGLVGNLVPYNDDSWVDPREVTNGAVGINNVSRHVAYVGGTALIRGQLLPRNTLNKEQNLTLVKYVRDMIKLHPDILVCGHNQFANKACPSFWVPKWAADNGIPAKNIYTADPFGYSKIIK